MAQEEGVRKVLIGTVLVLLSLGVASATEVSCTDSAGPLSPINSSTVLTCGTLTFENFEVLNPTGGASGDVDILSGSEYNPATGLVLLQLNPNLGSPTEAQDEELLFEVVGGIDQIDMSVGGSDANVLENACTEPIPTTGLNAFECVDGNTQLATITVGTTTGDQPVFSSVFAETSPVYIFKNIGTQAGGDLSEFTESFETGIPEPATAALTLSGLVGLGLLWRRRRS